MRPGGGFADAAACGGGADTPRRPAALSGPMAKVQGAAPYIFNTSGVTVPPIFDRPTKISILPSGPPHEGIPVGCFVDGNDLIDSETGEILGRYEAIAA